MHTISPTKSTAIKANMKKTNPNRMNNVKYSAIIADRHRCSNYACNGSLHGRTSNTCDGQVVVNQMDEYCV